MNKERQLIFEICYLVSVLTDESGRSFSLHYYSIDNNLSLTDWKTAAVYANLIYSLKDFRKLRTRLRKELHKAGVPLSKYNRISFSAKA